MCVWVCVCVGVGVGVGDWGKHEQAPQWLCSLTTNFHAIDTLQFTIETDGWTSVLVYL